MKKLQNILLVIGILVSSLGYSQSKKIIKYRKDYNALEFKIKNETDSLSYITNKKINRLSYNLKKSLNVLKSKYASNDLKKILYKNKYQ
ncbi:hypothetical protein [Polaribacter sargassicola]|uniref:hypothetical protein n=1 Tax=Polaribacter sargassicola TaxID=2836891 RepID=UPI001F313D5F|nr:hypothetical protein [Polaribacter sp. DS7-9]MCG1036645.1 hypothetical protein [Polaribacter sp. DS7-9]